MISRTEQKARTRTEILAAARRVVAEQGFATTTARDVAAAAGVAIGTVFLHFPTMGQLAETLLDETVGAALVTAAQQRPDGLIERLVHVSDCLFQGYAAEPELSRQVIAGSLFESAPGSPSQLRMGEFRGWVVDEVSAAVGRGEIAPIDPGAAFLGYFALYFGALVVGLRGELDRDAQLALLRASLQRLFAQKEN
ncbi:TetR/AcrR family transcriptional regulator [Propionicimonas sp.]|uniref:TetR/AcrR family transcriptional regulator n=1 Tax=Propionicimonas sp. TaxID=1955623 RepID=UPI001D8F78B7|nr:TetR/AcrR family transcriptional regulator [Propionicimonas sp.]MBU3976426.1 TetR/AcrR family transcriptional regulator [Actinomycetota bacterium]MBU3986053.1 TetR/AcrR family transcriptional regulator [Actinomycetota bacterium]MBU4007570.1 TetR/AcrR family transcriptional regulator [Actinomycetota bacterium]MBU4064351.1 TetR/AcrR family transcriptional regulator [Actinomycetota bacterium]MBU4092084.1 TetR/AcrR family transcriptional regulator [Actinomycetota bacterium]